MSWFQKLIYGVDPDQDQRTLDYTDAELRKLNQKKLQQSLDKQAKGEALDSTDWTQETFDQAEANLKRGAIPNVQGEIDKAFDEGWDEGAARIRGAVGNVVGTAIGTPFKLIPWQLWLVLGVVAFFYLGGAKFLKGKL